MIASRTALVALLLALGCDAGTGGRRVLFDLEVIPAGTSSFHTSSGWDVALTEACISVGPLYLYAGEPTATRTPFYDLLVPSAHAHPGVDHFAGGEARGEWLFSIAIDTIAASPIHLGPVRGIAGSVRTVTLNITPPRPTTLGPVDCLRGHQAYVVGTARRDTTIVEFEGGLDIEVTGNRQRIQIPAQVELDDGATVGIVADPRSWLDEAQFDQLPAAVPGGRSLIGPDTQPRTAWFLGVQRERAFGARARFGASQ